MLNQADLNTIEVHDAYGLTLLNGLKNMERPADLQQAESQIWPERSGREYRLTDKLDDYDVTLECVQQGTTMADLITKKDALFAVLQSAIIKTLFVYSTGRTYNIKYNKASNFEFVNTVGAVSVRFNIELTVVLQEQPETIFILDGNG